MWIGLFSDIHANREALEATLEHARQNGIHRFIFLGDYVGYGADPCFCVDTVMREVDLGAVALRGNHDAAISVGTARMNPVAAEALDWTRPRLNTVQRNFLAGLPLTFENNDHLFVHASAHAPGNWEYIVSAAEAAECFSATRAQATFCGHVHVPQLYHLPPSGCVSRVLASQNIEIPLHRDQRWIAVIGSVGQPRDGNPAACYGALDIERNVLMYFRVPYDAALAARKINSAGLPPVLGRRLLEGA